MNAVSLIGNLASDVDLRDVGEDKKLATFLLAVPRAGDDGGAEFIRVAAWNKQAESCARYLAKGNRVGVHGRLRTHSWEDDGKRKTKVEVVAGSVDFLAGAPSGDRGTPFEGAVRS